MNKLTAVRPLGHSSSVVMSSSSGIEPPLRQDWFFSRNSIKKPKTTDMSRKKEWQPSNGAQIGDVTEFGVIIELTQSSWNNETVAKFDRGHGPDSRITRGVSNELVNWSRLERVIAKLIKENKVSSTKPQFKSMVKNLALLWECTLDEAFIKCKNLSDLEDALVKSMIKQKTIIRQTTDVKFGL